MLCLLVPLRQDFPPSLEASKPELSSCSLSARVTGLFGIMPNFLCGLWRFELRTSCLARSLSTAATPKPGKILNSLDSTVFSVVVPLMYSCQLCGESPCVRQQRLLQAHSQWLVEMVTIIVHTVFSKRLFYAEHFPACLI